MPARAPICSRRVAEHRAVRILVYSARPYDRKMREAVHAAYDHNIGYYGVPLRQSTMMLSRSHEVACAFVNDDIRAATLQILKSQGVGLVLLRCTGYNNILILQNLIIYSNLK